MPALPYNANIPQATDEPANSQPLLLQNAQSVGTLIPVDHVDFSVNDDYGKHKKVTFPVQTDVPTFGATELGVYSFLFNTGLNPSNLSELYFKRNGENAVPYTATNLHGTNEPQNGFSGYTYLASGLLMQWGQTSEPLPIATDYVPTFLRPFRTFGGSGTQINTYQIVYSATGQAGSNISFAGVYLPAGGTNQSALQATFRFAGSLPAGATTYSVKWIAIGRPGAI